MDFLTAYINKIQKYCYQYTHSNKLRTLITGDTIKVTYVTITFPCRSEKDETNLRYLRGKGGSFVHVELVFTQMYVCEECHALAHTGNYG